MFEKRKITFVIWTESLGGIEKTLMYYPINLKEYEYSIFILRPPRSNIEMFPEEYFIEKKYGDHNNGKLYINFFNYVRKNRNTIFHVFNGGPVILLILKMADCKMIIYHIRGTIYWKKKYLKIPTQILWKAALSKNVKIIANSEYSKEMFLQRANKKYPVEVIYNPFEVNEIKSVSDSNELSNNKGLSICYVGRLVNGKNLFLWLDIAKKLNEKFNNISFHFYGKGNLEKQLREYAARIGIGDKLHFHGFLKNIEVAYQQNDLLMFLSEYESFGNVVVESILYGTPVVAKPIPSLQEIFAKYPEFLLSENLDYSKQVANKLKNIKILQSRAINAQLEFLKRFSIQNHLRRMAELYEEY